MSVNYASKLSNGTDTYVIKDEVARSGAEEIQNNLVTSVTSSSTDSQYPSAKCIYDLSQQLEDALYNLNSFDLTKLGTRIDHKATVVGTFEDHLGKVWSVAVVDAAYRSGSAIKWSTETVDTPLQNSSSSTAALADNHTGKYNTDLILDTYTAENYPAFEFAKNACSVIFEGNTYYSVLPNEVELQMLYSNKNLLDQYDPTVSQYSTRSMSNFKFGKEGSWASNEYIYMSAYGLNNSGNVTTFSKDNTRLGVCPVIEIPIDAINSKRRSLIASKDSSTAYTAYVEHGETEEPLTTDSQVFVFEKGAIVTFGIKNFGSHSGSWTYTVNGTSTTLSFGQTSDPQTASIIIDEDTTLTISASISFCCIPYYTDVQYPNNLMKPADQVQVGDTLIGYNENTGEFVETEVLNVTEVMRNDLITVTTASKSIDLTVDHPVLSDSGWASYNPEMTNATYSDITIPLENNLKVGMKLLTKSGEYEEITSITEKTLPEAIRTYTYNVTDGIDTYITNGFISHNHY